MRSGFFLKHTRAPTDSEKSSKLVNLLPQKVTPLGKDFDWKPLLTAMGNSKVAMIGEATHGTHDFYKLRAEITKQLIIEKGFNIVTVEGDWPDVYRINRYVCGKTQDNSAREALGDFTRFPRWMWRNTVVEEFVEWLRKHNDEIPNIQDKVRFYGLDLYSLFRSADLVIEYLKKVDPKSAELAKQRYGTLNRYRDNEFLYAQEVRLSLSPSREKEVVSMLVHMMSQGDSYLRGYGGYVDGDELMFAQQNARLVKDAEEYYRNTYSGGTKTWNLRDKHMFDTLESVLAYHQNARGKESRAVVWAHNSHLGDSRATEYARESGEWNLGQLVRQRIGKDKSFNVGFTTYTGTVTAACEWGGPAMKFDLTPAFEDSYEALFHQAIPKDWFLLLRTNDTKMITPDDETVKLLSDTRTERMIGVQYVKRSERQSHYVPAKLPQQFDSVIHIDVSSALQPLDPPDTSGSG